MHSAILYNGMANNLSFEGIFKEIQERMSKTTGTLDDESIHSEVLDITNEKAEAFDQFVSFHQREKSLSLNTCLLIKEKGSKAFRKRKMAEALEAFTHFIEASNQCTDDPLPLLHQGYSNRSACLQRLGLHKRCLEDVSAAIHFSPNPGAEYILYDRQAKCFSANQESDKARLWFSKAKEAAEKAQIPSEVRQVFIKQVDASMAKESSKEEPKCNKAKGEDVFPFSHLRDFPKSARSRFFDSLSKKVCIQYAGKDLGRRLVADADIHPGDVIAYEDPIVSNTQFDPCHFVSKVCHHCQSAFRHKDIFFPSQFVRGVRFCSWTCWTQAQCYHRHEAPILQDVLQQTKMDTLKTSGCMLMAFRAICRMPLDFFRFKYFKLPPDEELGSRTHTDQVSRGNQEQEYDLLVSLVGHQKAASYKEKLGIAIRAAMLTQCLESGGGYFPSSVEKSDYLGIAKLLFDWQFAFAHNLHAIYQLSGEVSGDIPLKVIGTAIYRAFVLSNHSCAPNTERFFHNGRLIVVAKRMIRKGEEVTNNYGVHHLHADLSSRRQKLLKDFKFTCQCQACASDFPTLEAISSVSSPAPSKKVAKRLDECLKAYQKHFSSGNLARATHSSEQYLQLLANSQVKYPDKSYEIGCIALKSCWWAEIGRQNCNIDTDALANVVDA